MARRRPPWAPDRAAGAPSTALVFLSEDDRQHLGYPEQPDQTLAAVCAAGPRLAVLKQGAKASRTLGYNGHHPAQQAQDQE